MTSTTYVFTVRSVQLEALKNIAPGILSPYNKTLDFQRVASALAANTNSPPTTRVSTDGMYISYRKHTLGISKWRNGLSRLASEIEHDLQALCQDTGKLLTIPDIVPDDWACETRGYSWTKNYKFLEDPYCLMQRLICNPCSPIGSVENGDFIFDSSRAWRFMNETTLLEEKLCIFAFLTVGQPARLSKFTDHKFANSDRPRTMFRDGKCLWLVICRVKTETQTR